MIIGLFTAKGFMKKEKRYCIVSFLAWLN